MWRKKYAKVGGDGIGEDPLFRCAPLRLPWEPLDQGPQCRCREKYRIWFVNSGLKLSPEYTATTRGFRAIRRIVSSLLTLVAPRAEWRHSNNNYGVVHSFPTLFLYGVVSN